jgi:hypothetical protein
LSEIRMSPSRVLALGFAAALLAGGSLAADKASYEPVRQTCKADFVRVCPDAEAGHGDLRVCATEHFRQFTAPCQSALKALRKRMKENGEPDPLAPQH